MKDLEEFFQIYIDFKNIDFGKEEFISSISPNIKKPIYTKERMGRSSWFFMHFICHHFSKNPRFFESDESIFENQRERSSIIIQTVKLFIDTYPCIECRDDGKTLVNIFPPISNENGGFKDWIVSFHNIVSQSIFYRNSANINGERKLPELPQDDVGEPLRIYIDSSIDLSTKEDLYLLDQYKSLENSFWYNLFSRSSYSYPSKKRTNEDVIVLMKKYLAFTCVFYPHPQRRIKCLEFIKNNSDFYYDVEKKQFTFVYDNDSQSNNEFPLIVALQGYESFTKWVKIFREYVMTE